MMNKKGLLSMQDNPRNRLNLLFLANVWLSACLLGMASLATADSMPVDQLRLQTGARQVIDDTHPWSWYGWRY